MSYPTMTVASIRALQELLSNVPPATSSSCSSLTVSGFWISSLIGSGFLFGWFWFGLSDWDFRTSDPEARAYCCLR